MATEAAHGESPTDYIVHHLTHLKVGSGFWTFHVDTLLVSASLALLVAVMLVRAARVKSNGAPSGLRAFVEWVYEFVDGNVADIYPGNRAFLVALGMTLFTWVVAMNAMDLLPLDLPGGIASKFGQLLDVAYNIEFGEETSRQSCLNLLGLLGISTGGGTGAWWVYGKSDERWKIVGGNQQISEAQADYLGVPVDGPYKPEHYRY